MKNRTMLGLVEQLIMVLVFALAAALCLQAFAKADAISRETAQRALAAQLAQNAAEALKVSGGEYEAAARLLGGEVQGETWVFPGEETGEAALVLRVREAAAPAADLGCAEICVTGSDHAPLFTLQTVWRAVP